MDSFILRVYRRDENDPENMVGIVEDIGTQHQEIFHDMNDLQRLLNQPQQDRAKRVASISGKK